MDIDVPGIQSSVGSSRFELGSTIPLWLDGKETTTSTTFDVVSPINNQILYRCSSADTGDVDKSIASAARAFQSWCKTKPSQRRDIFLRAAELFEERRHELYHYSYSETGAPKAMFDFDCKLASEACKSIAGLIGVALTSTVPVVEEGRSAMVLKEPYGVVLGIAPWNAPNVLGLRSCLQPLAMGNTVILKGPEAAPATYWALASILHSAGLPDGCLNTIYHCPANAAKITRHLIDSPFIKKINFTGSTAVGSIIASLAGQNLKPTVMELGGKASSIVCEDADIPKAALQCALGAFLHAGQICMATERILVHKNILDPFRDTLKTTLDDMFSVTNGKTQSKGIPQLISSVPVSKNKRLVSDAITKGAKITYGNLNLEEPISTTMRPIVLENVKREMDIYYTESFGPTVSLYSFDDDEQAIKIANDTEYGLTGAVFTEDLRRGLKIAQAIETGAVHINGMTIHDEANLPHGGAKKSGFGRFNGLTGLEEWVRTKTVTWVD